MSGWEWFLLIALLWALAALGFALLAWDDAETELARVERENLHLRGELLQVHGTSGWEW